MLRTYIKGPDFDCAVVAVLRELETTVLRLEHENVPAAQRLVALVNAADALSLLAQACLAASEIENVAASGNGNGSGGRG